VVSTGSQLQLPIDTEKSSVDGRASGASAASGVQIISSRGAEEDESSDEEDESIDY
jgi:hypothetical protein